MRSHSLQYNDDARMRFIYYGTLLYFPVFYSQIGSRIPPLAPLRVEFILAAILGCAIIFKILNGKIALNENKLTITSLLFFFYLACTIPFAFVKMLAFETYIAYLKFFFMYFLIVASITSEKRLRIFMYVYLGCISLIFVEPFLLSLKGEGFRYANFMMRLYGVTGMFDHPNQLGGITAANIPFFYYMIYCHRSKLMKFIFALHILIGIRVIMLTQSRTAFIGAISSVFFIWAFSKRKGLGIILLVLFLCVVWVFSPPETKDRFKTLGKSLSIMEAKNEDQYAGDEEVGSMNSRWLLMKHAFEIFLENPVFGVGIHNFQSVSGRRYGVWFPPHMLYLEALSEIGIVGSAFFTYVLVLIFKNLNRTKKILEEHGDKGFFYYINMALFIYLLQRFVIGLFGQDLYRNWWWVAGGLSVVCLRIVKSKYLPEKA